MIEYSKINCGSQPVAILRGPFYSNKTLSIHDDLYLQCKWLKEHKRRRKCNIWNKDCFTFKYELIKCVQKPAQKMYRNVAE